MFIQTLLARQQIRINKERRTPFTYLDIVNLLYQDFTPREITIMDQYRRSLTTWETTARGNAGLSMRPIGSYDLVALGGNVMLEALNPMSYIGT